MCKCIYIHIGTCIQIHVYIRTHKYTQYAYRLAMGCVIGMCHWDVSLGCVIGMCHWDVSLGCFISISFLFSIVAGVGMYARRIGSDARVE